MSRAEATLANPAEQSDDEICDVLVHIDRVAYPDRYQLLRDEYVRRHGEHINGQPIDVYFDRARKKRPFAARSRFKKRMLLALAVWSLLMLAVRAATYLFSHGRSP